MRLWNRVHAGRVRGAVGFLLLLVLPVAVALVALLGTGGCLRKQAVENEHQAARSERVSAVPRKGEPSRFTDARRDMLDRDLAARDITDENVLRAMGKVPRQEFVPDHLRDSAYADRPLPIGEGQTISQPYIVALMTQLAGAKKGDRALDIGTGSGYQAAILAEICDEVYSIEIVKPLADKAAERLAELGYENVTVRHGDGYRGWPDQAPFDVILVAAAPGHVPQPLIDQLAAGGRLVIPVGRWVQELIVIERDEEGKVHRRDGIPVRFVPMTGEAERQTQ